MLKHLRTGKDGCLRVDAGVMAGNQCNHKCCETFFTGDPRANQTAQTTTIHAMLVRLHNYFAKQFKSRYPKLRDDGLFNLARALNIDVFCSITYNYWLPLFISMTYNQPK